MEKGRWVLKRSFTRAISWDAHVIRKDGITLRQAYERARDVLTPDQRKAVALARRNKQVRLKRRQDGAEILIFGALLMVLKVRRPEKPAHPNADGTVDLLAELRSSIERDKGRSFDSQPPSSSGRKRQGV